MNRVYCLYRWMNRLYRKRIPIGPDLIRKYIRVVYACDLPYTAEIGEGTQFPHNGLGVVIHGRVKIGRDCKIYQNVTIGGDGRAVARPGESPMPILGDRVTVFSGAVLAGPIVIGNDAVIAANAVVLESVHARALVGGVPARILRRN